MTTIFSSLSMINLLALGFAALTPALVLAYRKRDKRVVHKVSSLLCFADLTTASLPRSKIQLPLRFFIELLALLLLIFSAALPVWNEHDYHSVILLDNSMSMSSVDGDQTRLAHGISELRTWLDADSLSESYTLYVTSPQLKQVSTERVSKSVVLRELDDLVVVAAEDGLARDVNQISTTVDFQQMLIVSDKEVVIPQQSKNKKIETISVGSPAENIFIGSLSYSEGVHQGKKQRNLDLLLQNDSTSSRAFNLSIFGQRSSDSSLAEVELSSLELQIAAKAQREIEIPLPSSLGGIDLFRVEISAENDAIKLDNQAWININRTQSSVVLLVSKQESSSALGLADINGVDAKAVSPEVFSKMTTAEIEKYRSLILHRRNLSKAYRLPTMIIAPEQSEGLFQLSGVASSMQISSWLEYSPLTTYLQVPLLSGVPAVIFAKQPWLQTVINSTDGSVVSAGENQGVKFLAIGFEILPFEGAKSPTTSVFTLNALNWLNGDSGSSATVEVGKSLEHDLENASVVVLPSGQEQAFDRDFIAISPGFYRISNDSQSQVVAVNSIFPTESLTLEAQQITLTSPDSELQKNTQSTQPLWPIAALAVLLLFALEFLLRRREFRLVVGVADA